MKKGFTMIELIFVIVILGILASVAIPRLAATRDDAEISSAVANLRTLVSDASAYYTVKGTLTGATWGQITSVPLTTTSNGGSGAATTTSAGATDATTGVNLKVGDVNDCITVALVEKTTGASAAPAHIKFTKKASGATGVCAAVLGSDPLKAYFDSKIPGDDTAGKMPIGSTAKIY